MEHIRYYWVEGKSDLEKIESLLGTNGISYSVKSEKMKVRMQNEIHQERKDVYLIFVNAKQILKADELINSQSNCTIKVCISKKVEYEQNSEKNVMKEVRNYLFAFVIATLVFLSPIGLISNTYIVISLLVVRFVCIVGLVFYSAKTNVYAVLSLLGLEGAGAFFVIDILFKRDSLKATYIFSFISKDYLFIFVLLMIITIMIGAFYGLRNYSNKTFGKKVGYCILIVVGYLFIMMVTIIGYGKLYDNYHNEVYIKYREKLLMQDYVVEEFSSIYIRELEENTEEGCLFIEGYYQKEQGGLIGNINPYRIVVREYDDKHKLLASYYIEPGTNAVWESDIFGTSNRMENLYFSAITYFTIGYGEIYPIAEIVRRWTMQEALIAHIMTLLIVPTLMVVGQLFITKKSEIGE